MQILNSEKLVGLDFSRVQKGKENLVADALSRVG